MKKEKILLRKKILDMREELTAFEVEQKSRIILEKFLTLKQLNTSSLIMSYVNFGKEVSTRELLTSCISYNKRVAVPLVVNDCGRKELWACEINDLQIDLETGTFGILEPIKEKAKRINSWEIDIVVVPGVVFDTQRQRVGYGAGYYDRFLKEIRPDCFKVGIAYDIQIIDNIPYEEHDVPLDLVITENRII